MIFGGKRTSMWSTFDDGTSEIGGGVAAFVGILISIPLLIFGLQNHIVYNMVYHIVHNIV